MFKMMLATLTVLTASVVTGVAEPAGSDATSISQLLHGMFDKPNETLSVEPVMVAGDHAIADWTQGEMGGRALLRRQHQSWTLILCAGDGIKSSEALMKAGVPAANALKLESQMATEEAKLAPEKAALFSRFEGLVMMNGKDAPVKHSHH